MYPPLLHTQALQTVSQRGLLLQVSAGRDWEDGDGRGVRGTTAPASNVGVGKASASQG